MPTGTPPDTFVDQVRDALGRLHDLRYLQQHPLAQIGERLGSGSATIAGQRLRRKLVDAVETLNPGKDLPFLAPPARLYHLLNLHYVDGMTIREVAHELGISPRQALRGLREAETSVAVVLWAQRAPDTTEGGELFETSSLEAEMRHLGGYIHHANLNELVLAALDAVSPLATRKCVNLHVELPADPVVVSIDPLVAQHLLLSTVSRAIGQAQTGLFDVTLLKKDQTTTLTLRYILEGEPTTTLVADNVIAQLADRLGWSIDQSDRTDGRRIVFIHIAAQGPTVLVIDDNEGLVNLLQRYLTDQNCRVAAATDGLVGLRLAQELRPNVIVLDVMMPGTHGWEVLQRLRADRDTADIPVIICSVINNPDLAQALGASIFLAKPVRQHDILAALNRLQIL